MGKNIDLVGGLEPWNFMTFHSVGNVIIPTGPKSMIFQRGRLKPPTSVSQQMAEVFLNLFFMFFWSI